MINLNTSLESIKSIGSRFLPKLKKLGLLTISDLLYHIPYRYEDWSNIVNIADLKEGEINTIQGTIKNIKTRQIWRKRMTITEAVIKDETGEIKAIWFNQPYISKILKNDSKANFAGKLSKNKKTEKNEAYLSNPAHELIGKNETKHTGRLVSIYPSTKGFTSRGFRYIINGILENLENVDEFIPEEVLAKNNLPEINESLRMIHLPKNQEEIERSKKRFAFEKIFLLQLRNLKQKATLMKDNAIPAIFEKEDIDKLIFNLPFKLTKAQKRAIDEVLEDISKPRPMNRLIQGDVGSGKTIVAGIAAIAGAKNFQVAIMAPTEILANQHYKTLTNIFKNFSGGMCLLLSKDTKAYYGEGLETEIKKENLLKEISKGEIKIIIGTHALIQKNVEFKDIGLIVIDEQHRFGVEQRAALSKNKTIVPHFLSMSATPIPRTLMITIFGDLDVSLVNELPKGRREIITKVVSPDKRMNAYAFIRGQVRKGDQVFVICPRIDMPKEIDPETGEEIIKSSWEEKVSADAKNVKQEYELLSKKIFPDLKVAMLHGKLKSNEKEKTMKDFSEHKYDILVSTSVIEVGVDVPNATIIIIEGADRFGLAQMYQFRGRVGRGNKQSFCMLFTESNSDKVKHRLESLITAKNGFELAEYDLELRGPGEFLGGLQTGMPDVAMQALQNPELIKNTRSSAEEILKKDSNLDNHPALQKKLKEFKEIVHLE